MLGKCQNKIVVFDGNQIIHDFPHF